MGLHPWRSPPFSQVPTSSSPVYNSTLPPLLPRILSCSSKQWQTSAGDPLGRRKSAEPPPPPPPHGRFPSLLSRKPATKRRWRGDPRHPFFARRLRRRHTSLVARSCSTEDTLYTARTTRRPRRLVLVPVLARRGTLQHRAGRRPFLEFLAPTPLRRRRRPYLEFLAPTPLRRHTPATSSPSPAAPPSATPRRPGTPRRRRRTRSASRWCECDGAVAVVGLSSSPRRHTAHTAGRPEADSREIAGPNSRAVPASWVVWTAGLEGGISASETRALELLAGQLHRELGSSAAAAGLWRFAFDYDAAIPSWRLVVRHGDQLVASWRVTLHALYNSGIRSDTVAPAALHAGGAAIPPPASSAGSPATTALGAHGQVSTYFFCSCCSRSVAAAAEMSAIDRACQKRRNALSD